MKNLLRGTSNSQAYKNGCHKKNFGQGWNDASNYMLTSAFYARKTNHLPQRHGVFSNLFQPMPSSFRWQYSRLHQGISSLRRFQFHFGLDGSTYVLLVYKVDETSKILITTSHAVEYIESYIQNTDT